MPTTDVSGTEAAMQELEMRIRRYRAMILAVDVAAMGHQAILNDPTADSAALGGALVSLQELDRQRARAEWKVKYYEGVRCQGLVCFFTCLLSSICWIQHRCSKYPGYDAWRSENPSPFAQLRRSEGARAAGVEVPAGSR
jgi:hypothetical protein